VRAGRIAAIALTALALGCGKSESRPNRDDSDEVAGAPAARGGSPGMGGDTFKDGDPELSRVHLNGAPIYTRVQRLTYRQWQHAVTDILRLGEAQDFSPSFAPVVSGVTDFDNNERILSVDPANFVDFEQGAEAAAALATKTSRALAAIYDGDDVAGFVKVVGRRAFRRPLTPEEQTKFETVFALGERLYGAGFENGAALVIRGLLQSPHFLYRTELGPARERLSGYELASKLSFWLIGTTPSDALLDAAAAGDLDDDDSLEDVARGMLDDDRAIETMRDFHEQLLAVQRYGELSKVGLPEFDPSVSREFLPAADAFFDRIFQAGLGLGELLTSQKAYVGPALAPFYGLPDAPAALELRDIGPTRAGYFMQVPFLMLGGENDESDLLRRAAALERLTCGDLGRPAILLPPLPPLQPGETNRQRVSKMTETCGVACHAVYLNPLGFSLEGFDGLGRQRDRDNGQPIDTSGSYPFAEGVASFSDGRELMNTMAASLQVHTCYSKKVASYALGRDMVEQDRPLVESMAEVSLKDSLKELALALVRAPAFRIREEGMP